MKISVGTEQGLQGFKAHRFYRTLRDRPNLRVVAWTLNPKP